MCSRFLNLKFNQRVKTNYSFLSDTGMVVSVCQWPGRPGFNPRSSHTKDLKKKRKKKREAICLTLQGLNGAIQGKE